MNIFEALRQSHDTQRGLIAAIRAASETSDLDRQFTELRRELAAHAAAEERWFYLALIEDDSSMAQARHGMAEHHEMDELVQQLGQLKTGAAPWMELFGKLEHKVLHHLEDEEHAIFQLAGKVLSERRKRELAIGYEEAFTRFRLDKAPVSSAEPE